MIGAAGAAVVCTWDYFNTFGPEATMVGRKRIFLGFDRWALSNPDAEEKARCQESFWPQDHPATVAVERILRQLLKANGLDGFEEFHIINAPGKQCVSLAAPPSPPSGFSSP